MKNKMLASLILIVFLVVVVLGFIHTAMMIEPVSGESVITSAMSMCQVVVMNLWTNLFEYLPTAGSLVFYSLIILAMMLIGTLFHGFNRLQVCRLNEVRRYIDNYFPSFNFLQRALRRGLINPKIF